MSAAGGRGASLAAFAGLGFAFVVALLVVGRPAAGQSPLRLWLQVAVGQLAWLALLPAIGSSFRGRSRRWRVLATASATILLLGGHLAFAWSGQPAAGGGAWFRALLGLDLACLALFAAFNLLARACRMGAGPGSLLALLLVTGIDLAPFGVDPWLDRPEASARRLDRGELERLLSFSPAVCAAPLFLGQDLFKQEPLYRNFRVGEQLVATPPPDLAVRRLFGLAGLLVLLAGLIHAGLTLCRRRASGEMPAPTLVRGARP